MNSYRNRFWLILVLIAGAMTIMPGCEALNAILSAPTITVTSPAPGTTITTPDIIISGSVMDNEGISAFQYTINSTASVNAMEFYNSTSQRFELPVTGLDEGNHVITFSATDVNGYTSTYDLPLTVDLSATVPDPVTLTLVSPADGSSFIGDALGVAGTLTGSDQLETLTYTLNDGEPVDVLAEITVEEGAFHFVVTEGLIVGDNTLVISATGADASADEKSVTVTLVEDETVSPVTLDITAPEAGATVAGELTVMGTIDSVQDPYAIAYTLNSGEAMMVPIDALTPVEVDPELEPTLTRGWTFEFTLSEGLVEGPNDITVTVTDVAGNAAEDRVDFTTTDVIVDVPESGICAGLDLNGGAEAITEDATSGAITIDGWTLAGGMTATSYGAELAPTAEDAGPEDRGMHLFAAGDSERATALRVVNLVEAGLMADGSYNYDLTAFLGAADASQDEATLTATFFDAEGAELDRVTLGPVSSEDRGEVTALLERAASGALPAGTTEVELFLEMVEFDGDANQAFADAIAFELTNAEGGCAVTLPAMGATVTGSTTHALAITSFGAVKSWGDNRYGQLGAEPTDGFGDVSGEHNDILAVASGDWHSLALRVDGSILAWGDNRSGLLGAGLEDASSMTPVAVIDADGAPLTGVTQIVASRTHSLALTADGMVYGWGDNADCALGEGGGGPVAMPLALPDGVKIVDAAAGRGLTVLIGEDGMVWTLGKNDLGQLGLGDTFTEPSTCQAMTVVDSELGEPLIASDVVAGAAHVIVIEAQGGRVLSWGANASGQLGLGFASEFEPLPGVVLTADGESGLPTDVALSAVGDRSLAVTADGEVLAWGLNDRGQSINGSRENLTVATPIPGLTGVVSATPAAGQVLALDSMGNLWLTGDGAEAATVLEGVLLP